MAEGTSTKLESVADVEIDATGRFKYVLIKVIDNSGGGVYKYIVRGFDWANYHGKFCNSSATVRREKGQERFGFLVALRLCMESLSVTFRPVKL